jgi:hypothetical protein
MLILLLLFTRIALFRKSDGRLKNGGEGESAPFLHSVTPATGSARDRD